MVIGDVQLGKWEWDGISTEAMDHMAICKFKKIYPVRCWISYDGEVTIEYDDNGRAPDIDEYWEGACDYTDEMIAELKAIRSDKTGGSMCKKWLDRALDILAHADTSLKGTAYYLGATGAIYECTPGTVWLVDGKICRYSNMGKVILQKQGYQIKYDSRYFNR